MLLYKNTINIAAWISEHIVPFRWGTIPTKFFGLLLALAVVVSCASFNSVRSDQSRSDKQSENSQVSFDSTSPKCKSDLIDTTAHAEYLTEIERKVIIEINMARTDPAEYARKNLVPMRAYYHNKLLRLPGETAISTVEGRLALDECIKELQADTSLLPLSPKEGLTRAARDYAKEQGRTGATGHTGSDGSTLGSRINRYGRWHISVGENIAYGNGEARRIVTALLIDDGVSARMHRRNLLDGTFKFVGVAVARHRVYKWICVIDFAGAYNEATGPKK